MRREREPHCDQSENDDNQKKMLKLQRLMPKKKDYRMRAHINPLNSTPFPYPPHHTYVDWRMHYPAVFGLRDQNTVVYANTVEHPAYYEKPRDYVLDKTVTVIDIGCGYGGLLFGLAKVLTEELILGLEIRDKLVNFVGEKIRGHRIKEPVSFDCISVVRTNTMRHLCQYFPKQSLAKIFICFPDPHFKAKNYRRRIISTGSLSEYAYLLKPQGKLYCITDVLELHEWHLQHLRSHEMFKQVDKDQCVQVMINKTEEGQKVARNNGDKYWAVFQKK